MTHFLLWFTVDPPPFRNYESKTVRSRLRKKNFIIAPKYRAIYEGAYRTRRMATGISMVENGILTGEYYFI
ncbi:MAG: hypothetical protein PHH91_00920 [Desulfuromonadaceae bacterium]|nr:hypothetical protein [Desulfuromonadaceae bacterium]